MVYRDQITIAPGKRRVVLGSSGLTMSSRFREIVSDPEILGGTPVLRGTRVPIRALFDYLEGNHPLAEFLEDFPSVSESQALAVLVHARELLTSSPSTD